MSKFLKIKPDKGAEKGERIVEKDKLKKAMNEVRRVERAEKIQERILARNRLIAERARLKGDSELIERAKSEEGEAKSVLEKIQEDKRRAEADLRTALAELKEEPAETGESALADRALSRVSGAEGVSPSESGIESGVPVHELKRGVDYLEMYPVNEPYAYVIIEATQPPKYKIQEASLTKGEGELLKEIKTYLYETLDVDFAGLMKPEEVLRNKVEEVIKEFALERSMSPETLGRIMYYIKRDFIGYGRLDPIIRDKMAEDISADGPGIPLYVYHRNYGSIETDIVYNEEELDALIYRLSQRAGRHISLAKPLLDASLPTKDRLQLSIGDEVTTRGSTFTIRKFKEIPFTPIELVNLGTFSMEMVAYLWMAVDNGSNILIAGGTASGKTTVLNAIAMFIPPESKIVSIEDTREINLLHQNWIPAVTREVEEGGHSIEMYDLLRSALRQRPEYVMVGEVRGVEAHTLFQAMATGHITLSTIHAESVDTVVRRLTKRPIDVPLMLLDGLDIIAIQRLMKVGDRTVRRCTKIIEVTGVDFEMESLKTNELFTWQPKDSFEFSGESKIFHTMMAKLNLSEAELSEEFMRRKRCLEGLQKQRMYDFQSLNRFLHDYHRNPEDTEKRILEEG